MNCPSMNEIYPNTCSVTPVVGNLRITIRREGWMGGWDAARARTLNKGKGRDNDNKRHMTLLQVRKQKMRTEKP